jgi:hypothetical protein
LNHTPPASSIAFASFTPTGLEPAVEANMDAAFAPTVEPKKKKNMNREDREDLRLLGTVQGDVLGSKLDCVK